MSNLNRHPVRRAAVGVLAGTLAFTGATFAAGVSPANAVEGFAFERLEGSDRYGTAVDIAQETFPNGSNIALLARGDVFADALAGNYLAGVADAPILLTDTDRLPQVTEDGLDALGVETVYILGGFAAVSAAVEAELRAAGYTVERLSGTDRYFTAERIAQEAAELGAAAAVGEHDGLRTAILASGQRFPDALAGGALSYAESFPLTLTRPTDLPSQTEDVLTDLDIEQVIVVGGTAVISDSVRNEVETLTGNPLIELDGVDRWATAAEIADFAIAELGFSDTHVNLARADEPTGFADALTGGPHAGVDNSPIVLTFPNDLPNATAAWLTAHSDTLTGGHIFGGTAAVSAAVEAEAEELAAGDTPAVTETDVTVTSTSAEAGQPVTGTITGENIEAVTVSGPCVQSGTVTDRDTAAEGIQFSIPTNNDAQAGACQLTFTVSYTDERADETFTETVTITRPASATTRPELVSSSVLGTTTTTNATTANPAGTRVQYNFDEGVLGGTAAPRPAAFHVYTSAGQANEAGATIVSVSGNSVVVLFPQVNTTQAAGLLTVATVDLNAVTDQQGDVNPEGDAPLGAATGGSTTLPAGQTDGPDLVSVGNFRTAAQDTRTAVDFTFDEAAIPTANTDGYHLILVNNEPNTTGGTNDIVCFGPAAGDTTASGGTVAGGAGTTTITVICDNPNVTNTSPNGTALTATNVARGTVESGTVQDNEATPNQNVEQAADVSNSGNTFEPDLVSVALRPGATAGDNDQAIFTFDQAVADANESQFFLYDDAGNASVAGTPVAGATNISSDGTQVLVTFGPTSADRAVGGYVLDNAVTTAATASTIALNNEQDEVGIANTATNAGQTPGRTDGPDLTGVSLAQGTDAFGQPTGYRATYTFDEAIALAPNAAVVNDNLFRLYLADGTGLVATVCDAGPATTTGGTTTATVVCSGYQVFTSATNPAANGTNATSAQIGSATLGTVDNGAVTGADGGTNPEGAEFTSGGTGTRTA